MKHLALFVMTAFLLSGCTLTEISSSSSRIPVLFAHPNKPVEYLKQIQVRHVRAFNWTGHYDLADLLEGTSIPDEADMIINAKMSVLYRPPNFLLNMVTLGLAYSTTTELQGEAVRIIQETPVATAQ